MGLWTRVRLPPNPLKRSVNIKICLQTFCLLIYNPQVASNSKISYNIPRKNTTFSNNSKQKDDSVRWQIKTI